MIYHKLPVALLSLLSSQAEDATSTQIARHVLSHASAGRDLSVKSIAAACHVGVGTVSRFVREAGFGSFAELRDAFAQYGRGFERVGGAADGADAGAAEAADGAGAAGAADRAARLERAVASSLARARASVDLAAVGRLVADLHAYEDVGVYGLLKAQAAALDLQVDLFSLGKLADTCTQLSEQAARIAAAGADKLVVVFSYTATYFDAVDVASALRRSDRPRVWVVCGESRPLPPFVHDRVLFASDHSRLAHPYQLEFVAGLIAQEYAATL